MVLYERKKLLIFYNTVIDNIYWSLLLPVLPRLHSTFALSTAFIGAISSLLPLLSFVCGALQGRATEHFGRINMLKISTLSQLVGSLLILLSLQTRSVSLFLVARCLPSIFKCGMAISQSYLYDISNQGDLALNLGSLAAFSNLAFIVGPAISATICTVNQYLPFYLGCLLPLINFAILLELQSYECDSVPAGDFDKPNLGLGNNNTLLHYMHLKFAFQLNNTLFESMFAQHANDRLSLSSSVIGGLISLYGLLSAITNSIVLPKIIQNSSLSLAAPEHSLSLYTLVLGVGMLLWSYSASIHLLIISIVLVAVSSNLFVGFVQIIIAETKGNNSSSTKDMLVTQKNDDCLYSPPSLLLLNSNSIGSARNFIDDIKNSNVFGLCSSVDRAARMISPALGGFFMQRYGNSTGLAYLSCITTVYCLVLLFACIYVRNSVKCVKKSL